MAEANCHQEGGRLFYAKNDQDNALIEKLIRTMEINRNLNNTKCLLLGDWNLNNTAVFPVWSDQLNVSLPSGLAFSSLNSTRACVVQASDGQWYRNRCTFKICSPVCTATRGKNCDGVISQNASSQSIAHNYNVRNLLRWVLGCWIRSTQYRSQGLLTSYGACSTKTKEYKIWQQFKYRKL